MNGFIVEPGSKVSVSARLRSCAPVRFLPVGRRVARIVRQREHLAGLRVEHDDAAGLGLVRGDRVADRAGRRRTAPSSRPPGRCRWPSTGATLSPMSSTTRPSRSLMTRRVPSRPASSLLERELDAFLAAVLDVGEADDVRRRLALGVLALVLAHLVDALDAERPAPALATVLVDLAAQPDEVRVVGEARLERRRSSCRAASRAGARCAASPSRSFGIAQIDGAGTLGGEDQAVAVDDRGRGSPAARACGRSGSRPACRKNGASTICT